MYASRRRSGASHLLQPGNTGERLRRIAIRELKYRAENSVNFKARGETSSKKGRSEKKKNARLVKLSSYCVASTKRETVWRWFRACVSIVCPRVNIEIGVVDTPVTTRGRRVLQRTTVVSKKKKNSLVTRNGSIIAAILRIFYFVQINDIFVHLNTKNFYWYILYLIFGTWILILM